MAVAAVASVRIVGIYTNATQKIQKQSAEASELSALIAFHKVWTNPTDYNVRGYIYEDFPRALVTAMQDSEVGLGQYVENGQVNVKALIDDAALSPSREKLKALDQKLRNTIFAEGTKYEASALEVVERRLNTFDLLSIPFFKDLETISTALEGYAAVLKRTARHILPFLAIQIKLREQEEYRQDYLYLLRERGIRLEGLERYVKR